MGELPFFGKEGSGTPVFKILVRALWIQHGSLTHLHTFRSIINVLKFWKDVVSCLRGQDNSADPDHNALIRFFPICNM